ncbi:MAG TPA: biotin-dependent carboxyltransferase family protein [Dermatophilaceae bacterium]|nr:biotin-dependent carboxyltransferase family protein [Dermatophilaceae bacterium]
MTARAREPLALLVERVAGLVTVQDLGRPGHAHLAVPRSGALDAASLADANRLLGNPPGAAGLELAAAELALRADGRFVVAVTGAACPVTVDGSAAAWGQPVLVPDGSVLALGRAIAGVRSYVAVAGGVGVPLTLGSRSTDVLSGLGPAPLAVGDRLACATETAGLPSTNWGHVEGRWRSGAATLRLHPGPRLDWFAAVAWDVLVRARWTVTGESNRVGLRLDGPALARHAHARGELPSEGLVTGAVQVPPSGQPIVFLADHPTTGGYPVIAVVDPADLDRCGQLRPGDVVRLTRAAG